MGLGEEWRTLSRDDRYEISSHGRIRNKKTGRVRKVSVANTGYDLQKFYRDGVRNSWTVHRMVVEEFVGPIPAGMYVCHNDGDRLNNRVDNLRVDTPSENQYDTVRHGNNIWANRQRCPEGHEFGLRRHKRNGKTQVYRYCSKCQQDAAKRGVA